MRRFEDLINAKLETLLEADGQSPRDYKYRMQDVPTKIVGSEMSAAARESAKQKVNEEERAKIKQWEHAGMIGPKPKFTENERKEKEDKYVQEFGAEMGQTYWKKQEDAREKLAKIKSTGKQNAKWSQDALLAFQASQRPDVKFEEMGENIKPGDARDIVASLSVFNDPDVRRAKEEAEELSRSGIKPGSKSFLKMEDEVKKTVNGDGGEKLGKDEYKIGPGEKFATPGEAAEAVESGEFVEVDPGVYKEKIFPGESIEYIHKHFSKYKDYKEKYMHMSEEELRRERIKLLLQKRIREYKERQGISDESNKIMSKNEESLKHIRFPMLQGRRTGWLDEREFITQVNKETGKEEKIHNPHYGHPLPPDEQTGELIIPDSEGQPTWTGNEIAREMLDSIRSMAGSKARHLAGRRKQKIDEDDLTQIGMMGVHDAVVKDTGERPFWFFARAMASQYMNNAIRNQVDVKSDPRRVAAAEVRRQHAETFHQHEANVAKNVDALIEEPLFKYVSPADKWSDSLDTLGLPPEENDQKNKGVTPQEKVMMPHPFIKGREGTRRLRDWLANKIFLARKQKASLGEMEGSLKKWEDDAIQQAEQTILADKHKFVTEMSPDDEMDFKLWAAKRVEEAEIEEFSERMRKDIAKAADQATISGSQEIQSAGEGDLGSIEKLIGSDVATAGNYTEYINAAGEVSRLPATAGGKEMHRAGKRVRSETNRIISAIAELAKQESDKTGKLVRPANPENPNGWKPQPSVLTDYILNPPAGSNIRKIGKEQNEAQFRNEVAALMGLAIKHPNAALINVKKLLIKHRVPDKDGDQWREDDPRFIKRCRTLKQLLIDGTWKHSIKAKATDTREQIGAPESVGDIEEIESSTGRFWKYIELAEDPSLDNKYQLDKHQEAVFVLTMREENEKWLMETSEHICPGFADWSDEQKRQFIYGSGGLIEKIEDVDSGYQLAVDAKMLTRRELREKETRPPEHVEKIYNFWVGNKGDDAGGIASDKLKSALQKMLYIVSGTKDPEFYSKLTERLEKSAATRKVWDETKKDMLHRFGSDTGTGAEKALGYPWKTDAGGHIIRINKTDENPKGKKVLTQKWIDEITRIAAEKLRMPVKVVTKLLKADTSIPTAVKNLLSYGQEESLEEPGLFVADKYKHLAPDLYNAKVQQLANRELRAAMSITIKDIPNQPGIMDKILNTIDKRGVNVISFEFYGHNDKREYIIDDDGRLTPDPEALDAEAQASGQTIEQIKEQVKGDSSHDLVFMTDSVKIARKVIDMVVEIVKKKRPSIEAEYRRSDQTGIRLDLFGNPVSKKRLDITNDALRSDEKGLESRKRDAKQQLDKIEAEELALFAKEKLGATGITPEAVMGLTKEVNRYESYIEILYDMAYGDLGFRIENGESINIIADELDIPADDAEILYNIAIGQVVSTDTGEAIKPEDLSYGKRDPQTGKIIPGKPILRSTREMGPEAREKSGREIQYGVIDVMDRERRKITKENLELEAIAKRIQYMKRLQDEKQMGDKKQIPDLVAYAQAYADDVPMLAELTKEGVDQILEIDFDKPVPGDPSKYESTTGAAIRKILRDTNKPIDPRIRERLKATERPSLPEKEPSSGIFPYDPSGGVDKSGKTWAPKSEDENKAFVESLIKLWTTKPADASGAGVLAAAALTADQKLEIQNILQKHTKIDDTALKILGGLSTWIDKYPELWVSMRTEINGIFNRVQRKILNQWVSSRPGAPKLDEYEDLIVGPGAEGRVEVKPELSVKSATELRSKRKTEVDRLKDRLINIPPMWGLPVEKGGLELTDEQAAEAEGILASARYEASKIEPLKELQNLRDENNPKRRELIRKEIGRIREEQFERQLKAIEEIIANVLTDEQRLKAEQRHQTVLNTLEKARAEYDEADEMYVMAIRASERQKLEDDEPIVGGQIETDEETPEPDEEAEEERILEILDTDTLHAIRRMYNEKMDVQGITNKLNRGRGKKALIPAGAVKKAIDAMGLAQAAEEDPDEVRPSDPAQREDIKRIMYLHKRNMNNDRIARELGVTEQFVQNVIESMTKREHVEMQNFISEDIIHRIILSMVDNGMSDDLIESYIEGLEN